MRRFIPYSNPNVLGIAIWLGPVALLVAIFLLLDPRNAGFFPPMGSVDRGSKFGVRVGDPLEPSVRKLTAFRGVELVEEVDGGYCGKQEFDRTRRIAHLYDQSWRKGVVCFVAVKGRVVEIAWEYSLVGAFP